MATEMPAQTDSLGTSRPAAISRAAFGETELSRLASKASAGDTDITLNIESVKHILTST